jgi:hypothetical protein
MKLTICKLGPLIVLFSSILGAQSGTAGFQPSAFPLDTGTTMVGGFLKKPLTITNTGTAPLNISSVALTGAEFSFSPASVALPISVPPGGTSQPFLVVFNPSGPGARSGQLVFQDDSPGSPHTVGLAGFGVSVPAGDFAILAPNNIPIVTSIPAGADAIFSLLATGGPNNITLNCSGAPPNSTCTVPSSVSLAAGSVTGSDSTTPLQVSVATTAPQLSALPRSAVWVLAIVAVCLLPGRTRRGRWKRASVLLVTFCLAAMIAGCGGGGNKLGGGTPPGSYSLTLTATGNGGIVHTVTIQLGVRPTGTP